MRPELTPASGARNGGSPCDRLGSSRRSVRRSLRAPTSATAMARKSATAATGAPWKLPHDSTRPSGSTTGLSMNERSSRSAIVRACSIVSRAAPCTCGVQRSEYGVLDPVVADPVTGDDRRPGEQPAQVGRAHRLADLRPHGDEILGEGAIGAEQRLGRHRPGQVGRRDQTVEVGQGEHEHPEHPVGAVDEGEALLGPQRHRRHAGGPHRRRAAEPAAVGPAGLALADEHQRRGGQRGEVAAGAERAVLADDRRDPAVEQRDDRVGDLDPGPGEAHRQTAGPQEHHRPHHLALDLRAHPGGVRPDQRDLQLGRALVRGSRCWRGPRSPVETP